MSIRWNPARERMVCAQRAKRMLFEEAWGEVFFLEIGGRVDQHGNWGG